MNIADDEIAARDDVWTDGLEVRRANRSSRGMISVVGGVENFSVIVYRKGQFLLSSEVESDTKLV
eukprot:scaffold27827_cov55-Cyclotella_meneghiniana.AAC.2